MALREIIEKNQFLKMAMDAGYKTEDVKKTYWDALQHECAKYLHRLHTAHARMHDSHALIHARAEALAQARSCTH